MDNIHAFNGRLRLLAEKLNAAAADRVRELDMQCNNSKHDYLRATFVQGRLLKAFSDATMNRYLLVVGKAISNVSSRQEKRLAGLIEQHDTACNQMIRILEDQNSRESQSTPMEAVLLQMYDTLRKGQNDRLDTLDVLGKAEFKLAELNMQRSLESLEEIYRTSRSDTLLQLVGQLALALATAAVPGVEAAMSLKGIYDALAIKCSNVKTADEVLSGIAEFKKNLFHWNVLIYMSIQRYEVDLQPPPDTSPPGMEKIWEEAFSAVRNDFDAYIKRSAES
ncbi:hypothetical protein D0B54_15940 [Solimonas sp. K1W22B-7]|uniref:hypothetical protein n=1 Tax=Solimonas sp. K1W22B-7 TaxID=2303331 RepID=UPI000E336C5F|nr:hypothetical protein [Solimonas sp. K1W22B-7]AXQ30070.1 hypothetical protein D0B54_15940 [Solimonas sp. K1W22B-7]